tara:strand:- start:8874 stop:10451 length:1578 start_codon:yes stop_codon:yes gene_type:complete
MYNKNRIKIGIIGAGPNGLASALPFLKEKNKFEVTIISSGKSLYDKDIIKLQNYLNSVDINEKHKFWEKNVPKSKSLIPKKLFFGKSEVYENFEKDLEVPKNIEFDISHTLGGLSNVWGANVSEISNNDLSKFRYPQNLNYYLKKITSIYPISGFADDNDTNKSIVYNKIPLNYCEQAKDIIHSYNKNRNFFLKKKIRFGYSKLAVSTFDTEKNSKIVSSGLEMYGCHNNSVFNSLHPIYKLKDEINIIEDTYVKEIMHNEHNIEILCKDLNNKQVNFNFDKLILAAGTMNTSKLVLKLLSKYNKKSLTIKDSQKYFFLYFTSTKSIINEEKTTTGLSQIFAQTEINNNTFHIQLYHSFLLLRDTLNNYIPNFLVKIIFKLFNFILGRLMIGVVYFPEEISNHMKMTYDDKIKKFKLIALKNKKFSVKYILKIYAKLFSCLFKLKSLPLPIFIRSKIGVSQHFGSSLPPCENETIGNTLKNGELAFYKNIYVTDCSSLNRIPSTPPTFISMSNAYRISENITKNC